MDKYEIRRTRLIELVRGKCDGKASELAKQIGRSDSYVSRMLYEEGKPGKKRIGEDMADLITRSFGLPDGWLDGESQPVTASERALAVAAAFDALDVKQQAAIVMMIESYGVSVTPPSTPKPLALEANVDEGTGSVSGHKQSFGSF